MGNFLFVFTSLLIGQEHIPCYWECGWNSYSSCHSNLRGVRLGSETQSSLASCSRSGQLLPPEPLRPSSGAKASDWEPDTLDQTAQNSRWSEFTWLNSTIQKWAPGPTTFLCHTGQVWSVRVENLCHLFYFKRLKSWLLGNAKWLVPEELLSRIQ